MSGVCLRREQVSVEDEEVCVEISITYTVTSWG
jgi:hypothetical protein